VVSEPELNAESSAASGGSEQHSPASGGPAAHPQGASWSGGAPEPALGWTDLPISGPFDPRLMPVPVDPRLMPVPAPEPLPVEPQEYHQFYRAPAFRWWKPPAALAFVLASFVVLVFVAAVGYAVVLTLGGVPLTAAATYTYVSSPGGFALNNVMLALMIPVSLLASWVVFRQRPRWLSSVEGGFRWRAFWRFLAISAVVLVAALVVEGQFADGLAGLSWGPDSLFLVLVIVLTTPFQAAGEEYALRGLLNRSIGSWFSDRRVALVIGGLVNSVVFMLLHSAGDPWLNAYYLLVGVLFSILVWRTGGLEAGIALHVANNLVSESLLPFVPGALAVVFDRHAGVAGPETLIQMGVTTLVAGLLLWQSSRLGLGRSTAPGRIPRQPG
jgi:uncharacterized protein